MASIFKQIKSLHEQELHSNVATLASLVLTSTEHGIELLDPSQHLQTLVYYADALLHNREYKRAESIYTKALQFRKSLKAKTTSKDVISDIDIKFRLHTCRVHMKQFAQAIAVLQSINGKQRNAKVNMALGKLYQQSGLERSAITCYKEVLRECPLALEAAQGLLVLGLKGAEVSSLMIEATSTLSHIDWLTNWVKAQSHVQCREYPQAIKTLKELDEKSSLRDNVDTLVSLGQTYYLAGDHKSALPVLQRVNCLDPLQLRGMDMLSSCLSKQGQNQLLESLATRLMNVSDSHPEPWLSLAHCRLANKKSKQEKDQAKSRQQALYFAHKALVTSPRYIEGLLLKGNILIEMKRLPEAVNHFREALQVAPLRYEAHAGLVQTYLTLRRPKEAASHASNACQTMGSIPRTLTLYASVLMKDPFTIGKAKNLLEKALTLDSSHLPAVMLLADIYEQSMCLDKAIQLLEKQVENEPSCKLHQRLGDLMVRVREEEKAFDHYSVALNLDPNNSRVLEGLQKIEQMPNEADVNMESVDEVEGDLVDTEPDADSEDSEPEVWPNGLGLGTE